METNTVVLSLDVYNELREFKEKMESSGNVYRLAQPYQSYWGNYAAPPPLTYITVDEALIEVLERNKTIAEINNKLANENIQLKSRHNDNSDAKNMSIWEFIKWRKTKQK